MSRPRRSARWVPSAALAALGALLLTGWWTHRDAVEEFSARPPAPAPAAAAPPAAPPGAGLPAAQPVVRSAALLPPAPVVGPVRVAVPALGVDAAVADVGVDDRGAVDVPDDGDVVGWYRFGPVPGGAGSSVLVGHVDTAREGPGALHRLRDVVAGDAVRVVLADGTARGFRVAALRSLPKADLAAAGVFRRDGEPALTLVTCGGAFDEERRSYAENVVVTAVPVP